MGASNEIPEEPLKQSEIMPLTMGFIGTIAFAIVVYFVIVSIG
ncbi:hypothetical protein [Desulfurispira natronophila]|uniref:Uncharacterized protein n=1 Tax=Desulfurispira natronophila TaxID=682562 RepID=A0A7W7Y350_9BACT|nr:hypothetical protein [Desulfurispira natronophila]MBB5021187.1 hypothetical protein [Desulfurispira natronophila]